ncbi:sugar ABC transporter substrate-binding protein [Paenibacillus aceris]|uniref:Ribose transport system substrate-binding protein n=1 Tax=Paenibacillus aceris TaxID=869555 RepID=A0ABS4I738_9BACL|nr:substrate-binding domain-containing protein [Paenibacillus aceris]MBP1966742.1 ribose transport system substrate-binding protein [Paenibacillus aceris]
MSVTPKKCLLFLVIFSLFTTVGCRSAITSSPLLSSETPPSSPKNDQHPAYTFGIIYPMAHSFYEVITQLAEKTAAANSVQLVVKAPEEISLEQQIRMMETMIKQKVDGIAIDPIDPDALTPAINKAIEAGIPVICFESDAPKSRRLSYIGPDHYRGGALMGEVVGKLMKGKGMVLVESGSSTSSTQKDRLSGMLDYLSRNTGIQVLEVGYNEGSSDRALSDMERMIDDHPHFDTLLTLDILSSSASILLWKAKGLKRNSIAFGMMPNVKEALINGQITSVISQNEQVWGDDIIGQLLRAVRGETIPVNVDTGLRELTKDSPE